MPGALWNALEGRVVPAGGALVSPPPDAGADETAAGVVKIGVEVEGLGKTVFVSAGKDDPAAARLLEAVLKRLLASAHTCRMPLNAAGIFCEFRKAVWLVCMKQSAHWGKTLWNKSLHPHSRTSMKAAGLKIIWIGSWKAAAASAQPTIVSWKCSPQSGHEVGTGGKLGCGADACRISLIVREGEGEARVKCKRAKVKRNWKIRLRECIIVREA